MTLLLALVVGWCLASATIAFGLGPLLQGAAALADVHETPVRRSSAPPPARGCGATASIRLPSPGLAAPEPVANAGPAPIRP